MTARVIDIKTLLAKSISERLEVYKQERESIQTEIENEILSSLLRKMQNYKEAASIKKSLIKNKGEQNQIQAIEDLCCKMKENINASLEEYYGFLEKD